MTIKDRIEKAIDTIEQYSILLLLNQEAVSKVYLENLIVSLDNVIPDIINEYDKEYLNGKKDEQKYWIDQVERIFLALEGEDLFYRIDVLYNETANNLSYVYNIIE